MIQGSIEGTLPKINTDFTVAMERISQRMYESVNRGFDTSGYSRWPVTREGKPATLRGIRNTVQKESGQDYAQVSAMNTIHQRGGTMVITPRQKAYFWARWYASNKTEEKWKYMALNPSGVMYFPVRTYVTLQTEDYAFARRELLNNMFSISETINKK